MENRIRVITVKYVEDQGTFAYHGWIVARPMAAERGGYNLYEFSGVQYSNISDPESDELTPGMVIEVYLDDLSLLIPRAFKGLLRPDID